jgi:hypothetical protein
VAEPDRYSHTIRGMYLFSLLLAILTCLLYSARIPLRLLLLLKSVCPGRLRILADRHSQPRLPRRSRPSTTPPGSSPPLLGFPQSALSTEGRALLRIAFGGPPAPSRISGSSGTLVSVINRQSDSWRSAGGHVGGRTALPELSGAVERRSSTRSGV